jgi:hypothetical protein
MNEGVADKPVPPERAKRAMKETLGLVKKLGVGAAALLRRLKKDRSPAAMIETLDQSLAENRARRERASGKIESLHGEIVAGKKSLASASPARKRILGPELKSKLAEYKATERELNVLLENERTITQVKGRFNEIIAYDISGVSESLIDDVIDDIEDRAQDADAVADAARNLERSGRRQTRESDEEDFLTALADFGEDEPASALSDELAGFDEDESSPQAEPDRNGEKKKEGEGA